MFFMDSKEIEQVYDVNKTQNSTIEISASNLFTFELLNQVYRKKYSMNPGWIQFVFYLLKQMTSLFRQDYTISGSTKILKVNVNKNIVSFTNMYNELSLFVWCSILPHTYDMFVNLNFVLSGIKSLQCYQRIYFSILNMTFFCNKEIYLYSICTSECVILDGIYHHDQFQLFLRNITFILIICISMYVLYLKNLLFENFVA